MRLRGGAEANAKPIKEQIPRFARNRLDNPQVARRRQSTFPRASLFIGALFCLTTCNPSEPREVQLQPPVIATATVEPTRAPTSPPAPSPTREGGVRALTIDPSDAPAPPSPLTPLPRGEGSSAGTPVYSAFDYLRGYLTNRTYPIIVEGKAWTNSTVNVAQLSEAKGGVTYWDFFSELENWDSPFFMWQRDNGEWQPYAKENIIDARGRTTSAYVLLDRAGPGVMDKLWFTQDAVWMLETEESRRNVGPIESMSEFIEWGNIEKLGNLRIEVDDRVAYDGAIKDWFSGKALGLTPELRQILTWSHREFGSIGSIVPIPYQRRLRVLLHGGAKKPKWFLATGVRLPENTRVQSFTGKNDLPIAETPALASGASVTQLARNVAQPENYIGDARAAELTVEAGQPARIALNGAGTLSALRFVIAKKYDARAVWLRVTYGGNIAIDLPLVAFFGDPKHITPHRSTPIGIVQTDDAHLFYSNLPLPFHAGMTIELATNSIAPIVVAARVAATREIAPTQLWVHYRESEKLQMHGADYQVKLPGDGKLVGLVLVTEEQDLDTIPKAFAKPGVEDAVKRAWSMGYLEGNLALADGAGNARVYGGHEDWADGGFYFNRGYTNPPGGANRPFGGILRYKDGQDGYATIFRYFNDLSAFRFKNGLQMNFGHGTWGNNFPVRFGSTVYYYKELREMQGTAELPASEYGK